MNLLNGLAAWFADPEHWQGADGVPTRLLQHLGYSAAAIIVAIAIALPVGLYIGHTGRGGQVAINIANLGRAIPSLAIIILVFFVAGISVITVVVALGALALPPIVTNTYVGIRSVDREVREAAEGMGMKGPEVLRRVELPIALPIIMAGIRTSAVQVVATATLAAFIGLGGLGRYIIDGLTQRNTPEVLTGALLVALLSIATEYGLAGVQRALVSPGITAAAPGDAALQEPSQAPRAAAEGSF